MYYYDIYGWLSSEPIEGRATDVAPMAAEGNKRPNFTGHKWVLQDYVEPQPTTQPAVNEDVLARIQELEAQLAQLKESIGV